MLALPEFLQDISCNIGTVATELDGATAHGVLWQAANGRFLLNMPGIARYLVENGRTVAIEPSIEADSAAVNRIFRMAPLAALLYQRGILALHAAAVTNGKYTVMLAGDSGSGKSALLTILLQRGWTMLADELAAVALHDQGSSIVYPTFPDIALWPDAIKHLNISENRLQYLDSNRRIMSLPDQFSVKPHPLRRIFRLGVHSKNDIVMTKIEGAARFQVLGTIMYNSHIADALLDRITYLQCATTIAQSVVMSHLYRPRGQWAVTELADLIEKDVK